MTGTHFCKPVQDVYAVKFMHFLHNALMRQLQNHIFERRRNYGNTERNSIPDIKT